MEFKDYLKKLYGDKNSMTIEELTAAAEGNKDSKFVDLKDGKYVDVEKYNGLQGQLNAANTTISNLQGAVKKFDGVDVAKLQNDAKNWETKYNTDIANMKRDYALDMAIQGKKAKNPKVVKAFFLFLSIFQSALRPICFALLLFYPANPAVSPLWKRLTSPLYRLIIKLTPGRRHKPKRPGIL